jgi:hypothetical protein
VSATRWTGSRSSSTSSSASGANAERRRRALVALGVVVAAVLVAVLAFTRGGGPADRLVGVAPPDALAWAHASTHPADAPLLALGGRFPALRDLPSRLAGAFGLRASELDVARDVRPWLGDEAGIALLPDGRPLLLLAVSDRPAAGAALRRLGATPAGTLLRMPAPGIVAGLEGDVLAAGPEAAVRAALARVRANGGGLGGTAAYRRATAGRDGDHGLDAYAPATGVRALRGASSPLVRAAAAILDGPALEGVAAAAAPADGGATVRVRVARAPGAVPPPTFAPALLGRVPAASTVALLDLPGAGALAALSERIGGSALLGAARAPIAEAGLDLDSELLGPLRGEAALSLAARNAVPVFTLTARTTAPAATRDALARVQGPLADRLTGGAATAFVARDDGSFTLPVTAQFQPSYAIAGNVLVASTAQPGLEQMRVAARGIAQAPAFGRVLARLEGRVQALGFIDLQELLLLGERTGLASGSGFQAVRADLDPVRAAGAAVLQEADHPTDTTAELFLQIP